MTDEYAEIQKLRALWSKAIVTRDYIFIPLVMGIVAVSLSQLPNFPPEWRLPFLGFEGILLTVALFYWRRVNLDTDEGIVGLYGRMLELEKEKKMDIHTKYYYSYLKDEHRENINEKLGIDKDNRSFTKFRENAESKQKGYHYDLLIEKWNELERDSVKSRGHGVHNAFAIGLSVAYWVLLYMVAWHFPEFLMIEI